MRVLPSILRYLRGNLRGLPMRCSSCTSRTRSFPSPLRLHRLLNRWWASNHRHRHSKRGVARTYRRNEFATHRWIVHTEATCYEGHVVHDTWQGTDDTCDQVVVASKCSVQTHTVVAQLLFRRVHSFHAAEDGGLVSTSGSLGRGMIPMSLAPYCLPIFTYLLLLEVLSRAVFTLVLSSLHSQARSTTLKWQKNTKIRLYQ